MNNHTTFITPEEYLTQTRGPSLRGRLAILPCRSGREIASKVCDAYNQLLQEKNSSEQLKIHGATIRTFPDTEIQIADIEKKVRGLDVYLFQQLYDPISDRSVNDNLLEALLLTDAVKRHGARNITMVIPYHGYMRGDKIDFEKRQPIPAKLVANLLCTAGVTQVVTGTLHVQQIKGFYDGTVIDEIDMVQKWASMHENYKGRTDVIIIPPDIGAEKYCRIIAKKLDLPIAVPEKARKSALDVEIDSIVGNLEGKKIVLTYDDIISTAGSIYALEKKLIALKTENPKMVFEEHHVGITHGLFAQPAPERLSYLSEKGILKSITVTDSITHSQELVQKIPSLRILSLCEDLAILINRIHYEESLRDAFNTPNDNTH